MLGIAVALTRSWTALYTRGLPPDLRSRRRDETESDLHLLVACEASKIPSSASIGYATRGFGARQPL